MLRSMKPIWLQSPAQLSDHLRSFRKARGLTQAQLGALAGINQARMAKIERDPSLVSVVQLLKLFTVLRVRVVLQPIDDKSQAATRSLATDW
jgi:HTH-type transcriptional regulator / antitoxin HipB